MSDTTIHFHAGSNLAGYSPEGDITCSETWDEARAALVSILDRNADALADQCATPGNETSDGCESCAALAGMERIVQRLKQDDCSAGFRDEVADGSRTLVYWIALVPEADCEVESD